MTIEEAKKLCEVFGVNYSEHPDTIVTASGNVYLTGNVDPKDTSERILVNQPVKTEDAPTRKSKKNS